MMPGIAIQPSFPIAGTSAVRKAPPASDDRFSHALHEKPKAPAHADRTPGKATKADAADDSDGAHETAPRNNDKDDKIGQPEHAKDDSAEDGDKKKGKGDPDGSTLPPHMMAERTLASQWPGPDAAAEAKNNTATAGTPSDSSDPAIPTTVTVQAPHPAGSTLPGFAQPGGAQPATTFPIQGLAAQVGKDGGTGGAAPVQTVPTTANPAQNGVSVIAATTAETGNTAPASVSAALMAKISATQHGGGPGGSPQGAGGTASTSATTTQADTVAQIPQAATGQDSGNASADPDGQGGDGQPNKAAQNTAQPAAGAKGDTAAGPLPTAQMVPSSGSATSFAGALQQNGALARYTASAAAALATGTPANALPVQSLSIQLRPVELGSVTAHLKYAGSGLTIDIQVETPEAHRRLSNDSSDIVKSLQSLGFQVDKVSVRQAPAQPQTQSQGQPQQGQGQAQGQATGRDGSAGGFANQGDSPFSMSGQSGGNGHRQGSENGYENASERGIGMVRETADRLSLRGVFI